MNGTRWMRCGLFGLLTGCAVLQPSGSSGPSALKQKLALDPSAFHLKDREATPSAYSDLGDLDPTLAKGITFLIQNQNAEGSWGTIEKAGVTALALSALLEHPVMPNESIAKGLVYLESQLDETGRLAGQTFSSESYAHAWVCYALLFAEEKGIIPFNLRMSRNMLNQILVAQNQTGFWAYGYKTSSRNNLSLSYAQYRALLKARDLGVQTNAIDTALFSLGSGMLALQDGDTGAFGYQLKGVGSMAMTSAGLAILSRIGYPYHPSAITARERLAHASDGWTGRLSDWPLYSLYLVADGYSCQPSWGKAQGIEGLVKELLHNQQPDGSWLGPIKEEKYGQAYATALAVMSLKSMGRTWDLTPPPSPFIWQVSRGENQLTVMGIMPQGPSARFLYTEGCFQKISQADLMYCEPSPEDVIIAWLKTQSYAHGTLPSIPKWMKLLEKVTDSLQGTAFPPEDGLYQELRSSVMGSTSKTLLSPARVVEALEGMPDEVLEELNRMDRDLAPIWKALHLAWMSNDPHQFQGLKQKLEARYPQSMNWLRALYGPDLREITQPPEDKRTVIIVQALMWQDICDELQKQGWR